MGTRQIVLAVIFGVHWIAFAVLMVRRKQLSLALPVAVFTLLLAAQFLWASDVTVPLGPWGESSLPGALRASAIVLAVPSIGMMARRIVIRRRGR